MKIPISKEELAELYVQKKLSCREIASKFGATHTAISEMLVKYGVILRAKSESGRRIQRPTKYMVSKEELTRLYWGENLSPYQISRQFGCSPSCIFYKMAEFKIPLRTLNEGIALSIPRRSKSIARAINKFEKKDFDGSDTDKSYLIGFRLGDLNVRKNKFGETVFIASGTTKQAQLDLMFSLFQRYGKASTYELNDGVHNLPVI